MRCHEMQLGFICMISGFSKLSAIIRYCCHESLSLCQTCFQNAIAIPNFSSSLKMLRRFPLGASVECYGKKCNYSPDPRKRSALRYIETVQKPMC